MANRTNLCPNPSCQNNTTGWFGGSLSRATGVSGLLESTAASFNSSQMDAPQGSINGGTTYTFSMYFKATQSGTIDFAVDEYVFGSYFMTTTTFSQSVVNGSVYRIFVTFTANSSATSALLWMQGASGFANCILYESGSVLGTYFDGSTSGGSWTGTAGNSTSTIPINTLQTLTAHSIPSSAAFGIPRVQNEPPQVLSAHSIVPPSPQFGVPVVTTGPVTITANSIPSAEAFGVPKILTGFLLQAHSIPTALAFGLPVVTPGPVTLQAHGISSAFTTYFSQVTRIQVAIPSILLTRPKPQVVYEMVCVSRQPQPQAPPVFTEIDPIDWSGLSYTEQLSRPSYLSAGVSVSSLTPDIVNVLKDQAHKASEIWVYRNGKKVFAGPWLGWQIQGNTLTITAKDVLAYLDWFVIASDLVFAQKDQFLIGKTMVDQWQALDYGNFGIDTSSIGASGVLRDATYLKNELNIVLPKLTDLGKRQNGFDFWVDPTTRRLNFIYPNRGVDRSTGPDAVVFDARNVTNSNIIGSAGPNDIASEGIVTGTSSGPTNGTVYSLKSNLSLRAQFGRSAITANQAGVSDQGTADAYAQALIDSHGVAYHLPGPSVRVTPDADLSSYDVGDIVQYQLHQLLDLSGPYRLNTRQVVVSSEGQETVTPTFV